MVENDLYIFILKECPFAKIQESNKEQLVVSCTILAKPGSKKEKVENNGDDLIVAVNARAIDGEANSRIVEVLSKFFSIPKRNIEFLSGEKGKHKRLMLCFPFTKGKDINYYLEVWKKLRSEIN